tara:strand:+ start:154 stop:780 length:627 start_codon:yes stop_codon:yes gene_type:complete
MAINVTPIPKLTAMAAPAFTLGTANAAGDAVTAVASNSTLLAFDAVVAGAISFGASSSSGVQAVASRRDHVHGMVADVPVADGGTGSSSASGARSNLGLGTAAVLNTGVANGDVIMADATGLPAIDGSQVTGLIHVEAKKTTAIGSGTPSVSWTAAFAATPICSTGMNSTTIYTEPIVIKALSTTAATIDVSGSASSGYGLLIAVEAT